MRVAATAMLTFQCLLVVPHIAWPLESTVEFPRHEIDGTKVGVDIIRPAAPHVTVLRITRGWAPAPGSDGLSVWRGGEGIGSVHLRIAGMVDDDTPAELMGLRVVPLDSLSQFARTMGPISNYRPRFLPGEDCWTYKVQWYDDSTPSQEPLAERLLIYAVDAAGNLSATADTLAVIDPGRQ